jgi:threonine synthase
VRRRGEYLVVCAQCGTRVPILSQKAQCACGGLLEALQCPAESGRTLRARFERRRRSGDPTVAGSGVWRFRELLLPGRGPVVTHPEGNTALYRRDAVAGYVGLEDLTLKHEGENPTGSFKDRGMTVATTQAVRAGASAVACASTGNTSASMSAYAAQAGLPALVFVPAGKVAAGKLAQALAYGATTLLVRGDFDTCLRLVREASEALGVALLNSINPWRLEGQKTIVWEMLQQRGWEAPDWIVLPAGALGNTSAFGKALREAHGLGLIRRVPRVASIQARGASPFYRSFKTGFRRRYRVQAETVATAIRIGDPASHDRAVRTIKETRGLVAAVSDAEILEAKAVVDGAGLGCEPASAAAVAGARQLVRGGVIGRRDSVVAVLTGHLLKDPEAVMTFHGRPGRRRNPPLEIEPRLAEVERILKRRRSR